MRIEQNGEADERLCRPRGFKCCIADGPGVSTTGSRPLQPAVLPIALVSTPLRIETAHEEDCRWAVFDGDELSLQLCGLPCPDGSMDLVGMTLGELTAVQLAETSDSLLKLALESASERQITQLRCFVWDNDPAVSVEVLKKHGFQPSAALQCWTTDDLSVVECGNGVFCQPLADGTRDLGETSLLQLIAQTLKGSLDLTAMDPPSPEMLLTRWLEFQGCMLLTVQQDDSAAGLAVVTNDKASSTATLEYIGVAKEFRRQGVGQRLLDSARACAAALDSPALAINSDFCASKALMLSSVAREANFCGIK